MVKRKEIHVVPNSQRGGWDIKRENAERASKHFETKADAVSAAIAQAKRIGAEMIPHNKNGKISNPNSYGGDPFPQRDTKH